MELQAQGIDALQKLFLSFKCDVRIIDYIKGLGCASFEDFVGLVKVAEYEDQVQVKILAKIPELKDNDLQLSRLRNVWKAAKQVVDKSLDKKQSNIAEDLDEPLDIGTQETLIASWTVTYAMTLPMYLTPCDSRLGRLYRECQRLGATVVPMRKVRSLFHQTMPGRTQEVQLGNSISLRMARDDPKDATSVYEYYMGLRIMAYAYSIVGQFKTQSKLRPAEKVTFAPLSVNQTYADSCLKRTHEHPDGVQSLSWLLHKDELTRSKMVEHMRQGWPQGEALEQAVTETEIAWMIAHHKSERRPSRDRREGTPAKQGKTTLTPNSNKSFDNICKRYNDNRGCESKESNCPFKQIHVCNCIMPSGNVCESRSHSRMRGCPYFSGDTKGNGGGKGKNGKR